MVQTEAQHLRRDDHADLRVDDLGGPVLVKLGHGRSLPPPTAAVNRARSKAADDRQVSEKPMAMRFS